MSISQLTEQKLLENLEVNERDTISP